MRQKYEKTAVVYNIVVNINGDVVATETLNLKRLMQSVKRASRAKHSKHCHLYSECRR